MFYKPIYGFSPKGCQAFLLTGQYKFSGAKYLFNQTSYRFFIYRHTGSDRKAVGLVSLVRRGVNPGNLAAQRKGNPVRDDSTIHQRGHVMVFCHKIGTHGRASLKCL